MEFKTITAERGVAGGEKGRVDKARRWISDMGTNICPSTGTRIHDPDRLRLQIVNVKKNGDEKFILPVTQPRGGSWLKL